MGKYYFAGIICSAVTVTILELETEVFCENHEEPKPRVFWSQVSGCGL